MIVSIHIPKTAGTTIGYILDYGVRRRIFYDYSELEGLRHKDELEADIEFLKKNKEFLEKKFDVIHGHFHYKKYKDVFPEASYIVCLREPLSRTLSQYFHIIEEANKSHWLYDDLSSGRMGLSDFASLPNIKRAQSMFIDGKDIMDFDHVFLTEHLAESIHQFQLNMGFKRNDPFMTKSGNDSLPNTNPRTARKIKRKVFSEAELNKAKLVLQEDVELYKRAYEKFNLQKKIASRRV